MGEGERLALVGRNGSGKSTLLKIAAGLIEADGGTRFAQPGATIRYLPQEPSLAGYATTRDYVEAGLAPGDDPDRAFYLLGNLGLSGIGNARHPVGRRSPPRRSGAGAGAPARYSVCWTSPPIIWTCRRSNGWKANLKAMRAALVLISHDRRFLENLSRAVVWLDRGRTRRLDQGFAAFRELARRGCWSRKRSSATSATAKSRRNWIGWPMAAAPGASAIRAGWRGSISLRQGRREELKQLGTVKMEAAEGARPPAPR